MPGLDPGIHEVKAAIKSLLLILMHLTMDGRVIGERSDAVLRTAKPGHDVGG
jgi:hypothetical protein